MRRSSPVGWGILSAASLNCLTAAANVTASSSSPHFCFMVANWTPPALAHRLNCIDEVSDIHSGPIFMYIRILWSTIAFHARRYSTMLIQPCLLKARSSSQFHYKTHWYVYNFRHNYTKLHIEKLYSKTAAISWLYTNLPRPFMWQIWITKSCLTLYQSPMVCVNLLWFLQTQGITSIF